MPFSIGFGVGPLRYSRRIGGRRRRGPAPRRHDGPSLTELAQQAQTRLDARIAADPDRYARRRRINRVLLPIVLGALGLLVALVVLL